MIRYLMLLKLTIWASSAGTVLASNQILLPDTIPLVQYLYALMLSFWGGLAASLQRWARDDESPTKALWVLFVRDLVCSVSAGLLAFYAASHFAMPPMLAAISVFVAGYGGSRALEAVYTALEKRASKVVSGD